MIDNFARNIRTSLLCIVVLVSPTIRAWDYFSTGETTEQEAQMRIGAEFTKKWNCGVHLHLAEEARFSLYDQETGMSAKREAVDTTYAPSFNRSYTTLSLSYTPIEYFKIDAGYTLRVLGRKGWDDPNEYLRHRVFFSVSGIYHIDFVKLYIRERALCDIRTDSVNPDEKNQYNWLLRSRLGSEFSVPGKPVKPYLWVELENTLNAPEFQQKDGRQFISNVRTQAGVRWRVSKLSSLDFFYRFQYSYDRDINVNGGYYRGKELKMRLDEQKSFIHAIGIVYHLDW